MNDITIRRLVFLLTLFVLINIAQITTVNSKENIVLVEGTETIATKSSGYTFLANPISKSFNTFLEYDESKSIQPIIENIATSEVDVNLTGILNVNISHINGSQVSNLPIKLENQLGTIVVNATTNSNGNYVFDYLGLNDTYWVSLVYKGVPYYKGYSFTNGSSAQLDIMVYEVTRSDEDIVITAHQVLIQTSENLLSVHEYLTYENDGIKVFNNSRLIVWFPQEIRDFSSSIMDCCIQIFEDGAVFDPMDPIMPGQQYFMSMSYYLDVASSDYTFRKKTDYSTKAFHLFVADNENIKVTSVSGLEDQGSITLDDIDHTFYTGFDLEAGIFLGVNLVGLGSSFNFMNQIGGIILISLIPTFLVSYSFMRGKRMGKASTEDLASKKRGIFKKIIQLESDYEAGDVSENRYENLQSKYRKRVMQLMQLIDESRLHQSQSQQYLLEQRIEKRSLMSTLEKLEEDFKNGLISEEGYQKIKTMYEKRMIKVIEEIRKLEETTNNGE
jgi:hypothetical protein